MRTPSRIHRAIILARERMEAAALRYGMTDPRTVRASRRLDGLLMWRMTAMMKDTIDAQRAGR